MKSRTASASLPIDNPPVNALSPGVPRGHRRGGRDAATPTRRVKAMVLIGAGRSFIAGADIRQFGTAAHAADRPASRTGRSTQARSRWSPRSTAMRWAAGWSIALACHYRIAVPSAKVGLPEVLIGILPGGGGTQRLPRLIGPKAAMEMIVIGPPRAGRRRRSSSASSTRSSTDRRPARRGDRVSRSRIADMRPLPRIRDSDDKLAEAKADPGMFEAMRKSIARRARNQKAPYHCIAAVEAALHAAVRGRHRRERELFDELENSAEAQALRYAFFAEREVAKIPGIPRDTPLRRSRPRRWSAPARWAAASR